MVLTQKLEDGERPVILFKHFCLPDSESYTTHVLATSLCAVSFTGPLPHSLRVMDLL